MADWWQTDKNHKKVAMAEQMHVQEFRAQGRADKAVAPASASVSASPNAKTPINKTGQPQFKAASSAKKKEEKEEKEEEAMVSRTRTMPPAERSGAAYRCPTPLPVPILANTSASTVAQQDSLPDIDGLLQGLPNLYTGLRASRQARREKRDLRDSRRAIGWDQISRCLPLPLT